MTKLKFEKVWNDLGDILEEGAVIHTLARRQPNKVVSFSDEGIEVITKRSSPESRFVPKWMFEKAVEYLIEYEELSHSILTQKLRVMRSAFVMAALSQLNYIGHDPNSSRIYMNKGG